MKNVLFIAPPAGGKGTCSDYLVEKYGYVHISTGDLLRNIDKNTELGKKVNDILKSGKLVDDEIVLKLFRDKLDTLSKDDRFILDGFPRNINQAEKLDEMLKEVGMNLDLVIELDVPYEICLKRIVGRISCPKCHKVFNEFFKKPKIDGICDNCGTKLEKRSDDNEETFKERFDTYKKSTEPLIDYYERQEKLIKIDGLNDTIEKIVSVIK